MSKEGKQSAKKGENGEKQRKGVKGGTTSRDRGGRKEKERGPDGAQRERGDVGGAEFCDQAGGYAQH